MDPDLHEDNPRTHVNTAAPAPSSLPSSAPDAEGANNANIPPRSSGRTILRSRRNHAAPALLSTSPSSSSALNEHDLSTSPSAGILHALSSEENVPSSSSSASSSSSQNASTSTSSSLSSSPSSSSCTPSLNIPVKTKPTTIKELEVQCAKTPPSIDISDFECSLCFRVFLQPVTTVCGHVFCKTCLISSLKYSVHCPLCRHALDVSSSQHKYAVNVVLMNMIEKYFPKEHQERLEEESQYEESTKASGDKLEDENARASVSSSWTCIIPSIRSTCNVILSCGGF